jgi:hypothetical protein
MVGGNVAGLYVGGLRRKPCGHGVHPDLPLSRTFRQPSADLPPLEECAHFQIFAWNGRVSRCAPFCGTFRASLSQA